MDTVSISGGTVYPDLEKLCRLCLKENSATINIFDVSQMSIPLRIMVCTSLEVQSKDPLPKNICKECRIQLERSYYFRKKCLHSDSKLRKHIRLINTGKRSKVFDKDDEDDDDIDYSDSADYLKAIEDAEKQKHEEEKKKFEEELKEKFRIEEAARIFDEVKSFLINKPADQRSQDLNKPTITKPDLSDVEIVKKTETNKTQVLEKPLINKSETSTPAPQQPQATADDNLISCQTTDNHSSDKFFKFSYNASDEDDDIIYLIKSSETDENIENSRDIDDPVTAGSNDVMEITDFNAPEDDDGQPEPIESTDLADCPFDDAVSEDLVSEAAVSEDTNMFIEEKPHVDDAGFFIDDTPNNADDDTTNHSEKNPTIESVIQETLRSHVHLTSDDFTYKIEKETGSVTQVKVETKTGNVFLMEITFEPPAVDSLIEKKVGTSLEELKIFKCTHCPQSFSRRSLLVRHSSVHVKSKGYCCQYCKKWFACKSSLDRHKRVHTGEKPFACEECGRKFIQKEILKRHMVVHTGLRPYSCDQCDKSFVQKQLLRQHINLKHTENPVVQMHECPLCPKSFCHASGLSRHLLTHSGVSYDCKICRKKFNDKSAVKRHTITVHAKLKKDS